MKVLVTGSAGFIGFHTTQRLLARGEEVVGIDNLNDYYDPALKLARLREAGVSAGDLRYGDERRSASQPGYRFRRLALEDGEALETLFTNEKFDLVCHLAAQAGVRYSLQNPQAYVDSNLTGFQNILEACRQNPPRHLCFASSSSVYGMNRKMPFSESDPVDHPVSLYAATKKSNELVAHAYSHIYGLPCTGLRFFTVYGPWGRPDMAYFKFADRILRGDSIDVYNHGNLKRDFTYIDDIVEGVLRVLDQPPAPNPEDPQTPGAPYRIYNIGNDQPVELLRFIEILEERLGTSARKNMLPMQPGDVLATWADISRLERDVGYRPATRLEDGLAEFVRWYQMYHSIANS